MMYLSNVMYYTSSYFNVLALTSPEHGTVMSCIIPVVTLMR
jgi:hypothetical protein